MPVLWNYIPKLGLALYRLTITKRNHVTLHNLVTAQRIAPFPDHHVLPSRLNPSAAGPGVLPMAFVAVSYPCIYPGWVHSAYHFPCES